MGQPQWLSWSASRQEQANLKRPTGSQRNLLLNQEHLATGQGASQGACYVSLSSTRKKSISEKPNKLTDVSRRKDKQGQRENGAVCEGAVGATWCVQGGLGLLWSLPAASPTISIKGLPGGHEGGWGLKEALGSWEQLGDLLCLSNVSLCLLPGVK